MSEAKDVHLIPQHLGRREFLRRAGAGVAAPIGGWAGDSQDPPTTSQREKSGWASIPTREHYGDIEERLRIPPSWDLKIYHMAGAKAPVLTADQIRQRIEAPVGSKRLADIAGGKRTAIITFDDLTRPTPVLEVVPHVIAELKLGGIKDDGILFLASYGSHRPLESHEATAKLGGECVDRYPWLNHNAWENLSDIGRTSRGNRIKVNRHFMQADLRVTISGIKPHKTAGYSGGAKAVLPGVAWIESMDYFHRTIAGVGANQNQTVGPLKIFKNECRLDMVEAARLAHVDFSVQIVPNGYRKVIGVYAGDIVDAHHAACREANRLLRTECADHADVVIVNAYPQNLQAANSLGWARDSVREGGTAVLIIQNPQGLQSWHYASERWYYDPRPFYETEHPSTWQVKQAGQFIVYSSYLQMRDRVKFPAGTVFPRTWADTVAAIQKAQRDAARVALYPYAGIQHLMADLDG
jgi:nickel-dependent lactate racemase